VGKTNVNPEPRSFKIIGCVSRQCLNNEIKVRDLSYYDSYRMLMGWEFWLLALIKKRPILFPSTENLIDSQVRVPDSNLVGRGSWDSASSQPTSLAICGDIGLVAQGSAY